MKGFTLYRTFFVFSYACYLYFNKGIAYTYLSEITWLVGLLLVIRNFRNLQIPWGKVIFIYLILFAINALQMAKGFLSYPIQMVIRDSFILNYGLFMFIVFLFWDEKDILFNDLVGIYKYFPLIVTSTFLIGSIFPEIKKWELFGNIPILVYKNGDMAIHLLITVMLALSGKLKWNNPRFALLNYVLVIYLFLLIATFSRGGMLAFIVPFSYFIYRSREKPWMQNIKKYAKFAPLVLALSLPLYLITKVDVTDKDIGRQIGFSQLKENAASIVIKDASKSNDGLEGNVTWRLIWWGKIIDYTVFGPHFLTGKGLGVNLSQDDDIHVEDDSLRSPHNFSMSILARYGVPTFLIWLSFLFFLFQPLFKKKIAGPILLLGCGILSFFINASFDVSLEGPMTAFPFWSLIGIYLMEQVSENERSASAILD